MTRVAAWILAAIGALACVGWVTVHATLDASRPGALWFVSPLFNGVLTCLAVLSADQRKHHVHGGGSAAGRPAVTVDAVHLPRRLHLRAAFLQLAQAVPVACAAVPVQQPSMG